MIFGSRLLAHLCAIWFDLIWQCFCGIVLRSASEFWTYFVFMICVMRNGGADSG